MQAIHNIPIVISAQMQLLKSHVKIQTKHHTLSFIKTNSKASSVFSSCCQLDLTTILYTFLYRDREWDWLKMNKRIKRSNERITGLLTANCSCDFLSIASE
jgi:hypothetical protein